MAIKERMKLVISSMIVLNCIVIKAQLPISGTVADRQGNPIANVHIAFTGTEPVFTNQAGRFEISCPDDSAGCFADFTCVGYMPKRLWLYKGERDVEIILTDNVIALNEITVKPHKYGRYSDYSAQIVKMNAFDIYTNPQALGDVIGSMTILPGVQRNDNDGRLIIQGGATDETKIFVDGLMLFNPYSLEQKNVSVRSRLSPDLFNGVALQSSGYGAQFGNALSGILQLNTLTPEDMSGKTDLNISSVSLESTIIKKWGRNTAIRAGFSYMNLTPYGKIVKDNYQWNKYFNQYSGDCFFVSRLKNGIEMKYHATYNKADVDYSYNNVSGSSIRNRFREDNFLASAVMDIPLSTMSSLYIGANLAYNRFSGTDVVLVKDSVTDSRINSHQKISYIFKVNNITNNIGVENILSDLNESYFLDSLYQMRYSNHQLAVYDEFSVLKGKFNWTVGLREEYSTYLKKFVFSPRMYVAYKMSPRNIFSLSLGKYNQLPNEKYLKFTNQVDYNESSGITVAYSYVNKLSKLQVDAYWKKYRHLITFDHMGFYYDNMANTGKGNIKGINVFWKDAYKYADYWLSYGYVDANILNENFRDYRSPSYISNHTFNATLKYWMKPVKTMLGASFHVDAGATHYDERNLQITRKIPSRSRLDLSLSYVPNSSVIVHASCQNVLGKRNIYGYEYAADGSSVREILTPARRFYYIGIFITLSKSNINQLKSL